MDKKTLGQKLALSLYIKILNTSETIISHRKKIHDLETEKEEFMKSKELALDKLKKLQLEVKSLFGLE